MKNPFSLENKVFLVTGASSGIGKEVAKSISNQGGRVIITGRNEERLYKTYKELLDPQKHYMETFDLEDTQNIKSFIGDIIKKYDISLDGFVHCAGINVLKPLLFQNDKELEKIMKINFISGIELLRNIAKPKISNKNSSFVFISSVGGIVGELGALGYCSSKASLMIAVKTAALELSRFKYRVNCIAPGMIKTPMIERYKDILSEKEGQLLDKKIPLGLGDPKDVANASIFLLSDASKWITGTTLVVDGGYTCGGRLTNL